MTSTTPEVRRVAVLGTGLMGTSIAMAAARTGLAVRGWDVDPDVTARAASFGALEPAASLEDAVAEADLVVVATPIRSVAGTVVAALRVNTSATVTDAASVKGGIVRDVREAAGRAFERFVPGHPMGGSERSGPEHASVHVVDSIVWVLTPSEDTDPGRTGQIEGFVGSLGARPIRLSPARHDRLVAFVSHLPQVASTSLMGLAAVEEAGEPDILLLAAGGFRDLTRLAASNPRLWGEILRANGVEIGAAIDLFVARLESLRDEIAAGAPDGVERTFEEAKAARLRLATKPQVRAGVAVLQVEIPDEPGALARITATLGGGKVNIEDLQIVHSPEGGRGLVHLTVAAASLDSATDVLAGGGYDPVRLA
ncbi:MAG TPA: prephenate dehydrogenase/arogenate dehydrogenase family protein [Actinomycetota bacterium]